MHLLKSVEKCYFCLMKWLKLLLDVYVKGSIHVALSVFSLSVLSLISLNKTFFHWELLIVFFVTYVYYNLIKFLPLRFNGKKQPYIFWFWLKISTLLALIIALYILFYLKLDAIIILGLSSFFGILYVQRGLIPVSRENGWIKAILVSLVWALVSGMLPLTISNEYWFTLEAILLVFSNFFLVFALLVPFEIRDMNTDKLTLPNLAQQLGVKKIKGVGYLSLIVSLILWTIASDLRLEYWIIYLLFYVITGGVIGGAGINRSSYYTALWVEAIPIFLLISVSLLGLF